MYSLGVLIFDVLFNRYPYELSPKGYFDYHVNSSDVDFSILLKILPERLSMYGPRDLLECLVEVCLMCFHTDPLQRPDLDYIIVVLRLSMSYLTKIF